MRKFLFVALLIVLTCGCSAKTKTVSQTDRELIFNQEFPVYTHYESSTYLKSKNNLKTYAIFHPVATKPDLFHLNFNGYIIGLEKCKSDCVGKPTFGLCAEHSDTPCLKSRSQYYKASKKTREWLECRMGGKCGFFSSNSKAILPTVVARYGELPENDTILYNAYGTQYVKQTTPDAPDLTHMNTLYNQGWKFIENDFKNDFLKRVETEKYTHLIFISMGWNTPQWEAYANFNDIQRNLIKNAKEEGYGDQFKPLFIGITWPSQRHDKLWGPGDFPIAANDADEIGMSVAALIIQNVMAQAYTDKGKPKLVLIGHSLGALLVTRAADSGYFITDTPSYIDLVIGLEGAFSLKRFTDPQFKKHLWAFNDLVRHSFYTSSRYDDATLLPSKFGGHYIGSSVGFKEAYMGELTDDPDSVFNFVSVKNNGEFRNGIPSNGKITLVEASNLIYKNAPGSSKIGKAHSDIYKPEVGNFMWQAIRGCTIDNQ